MDNFLLLKMTHILSAVILAGTGGGIAFFMFTAYLSNNVTAIAVTTRNVVLADWIFTAPAVVLQFVTGILLMLTLGYSFTSSWFCLVVALFTFIGACWIPVVLIQYKLKRLADASLKTGLLDPEFRRMMRWWVVLGIPAFGSILILFWLMIFKPFPFT